MSDPFGDNRDPLVKSMARNDAIHAGNEIDRLRALNDELVAALEDMLPYVEVLWPLERRVLKARAVIAKAKGEK